MFTRFLGRTDSRTPSQTDRPECTVPPAPFFNGGRGTTIRISLWMTSVALGACRLLSIVNTSMSNAEIIIIVPHEAEAIYACHWDLTDVCYGILEMSQRN